MSRRSAPGPWVQGVRPQIGRVVVGLLLAMTLPARAEVVDYTVKDFSRYHPPSDLRTAYVRERAVTSRLMFMMVDAYRDINAPGDGGTRRFWVTDGTCAGTAMLREGGRTGAHVSGLIVALNDFGFFAIAGELWRSDGSEAGTIRIADVTSPVLTKSGEHVYFESASGLWRTDGTAEGTGPASEIPPFVRPKEPFFFRDSTLWKTDGTDAGTVSVKVIDDLHTVEETVIHDGILYFIVNALRHPFEPTPGLAAVWRSDFTAEGTVRLFRADTLDYSAHGLTAVPGRGVVFQAGPATRVTSKWGPSISFEGALWVADAASTEIRALTQPYGYLVDEPTLLNGVLLFVGRSWLSIGGALQGLTLATVCGDGIVTPDEGCDDGNRDDGDCCSNTCVPRSGDPRCSVDPPCALTVCGDGVLHSDEECDDGNDVDDDCCRNVCVPNSADTPCSDRDVCTTTSDTCDGAGHCGVPISCTAPGCSDGTRALLAVLSADVRAVGCDRLPRRLLAPLSRASRYARRAGNAKPDRVARWLARVDRSLARGQRRAQNPRVNIATACRTAVAARYDEARSVFRCLVTEPGS